MTLTVILGSFWECWLPGILQQFAISEATLLAWSSMDGESPRSGSNQGSVAHLSEVNQESITSRGRQSSVLVTFAKAFSFNLQCHACLSNLWTSIFLQLCITDTVCGCFTSFTSSTLI